jgi:hypothetical protein
MRTEVEDTIFEAESSFSPDTKSTSVLILGFPTSCIARNNFSIGYKSPRLWRVVIEGIIHILTVVAGT